MDTASISPSALTAALRDLRHINRWLGGYRATDSILAPILQARSSLRILDLATGGGDYLAHLIWLGDRHNCTVTAVGIDANPVTVGYARSYLDAVLTPLQRRRASVEVGDAFDIPAPSNAYDVAHAALFLHHLHDDAPARLLHEMDRLSRTGLLINDLHRHPLAYAGIWALTRLARAAPMVQHDAPLSVARGFRRAELAAIVERADLASEIRWHWAFRWTLSTL